MTKQISKVLIEAIVFILFLSINSNSFATFFSSSIGTINNPGTEGSIITSTNLVTTAKNYYITARIYY